MIQRRLTAKLRELAGYYPVVTVTGPRQSGKTTLCRATFPNKAYVSLESLDDRDFAQNDPRGFLAACADGAIIDEVQQAPELLSYLQGEVDERPSPGRFVLTGSRHLGLSEAISQTLAGRCGLLTLLPPSMEELSKFPNAPDQLYPLLWQGSYPRIYDQKIPAQQWLGDYLATYIERDVRQVLNVGDLQTFTQFLKLCAGRTAQEINYSSLGADAGVSHNTARSWLSILEASYIIHRLPAWHANIRKQVTKAAKLHFLDSGLVCHLLGIHDPQQLQYHPLRGAIFESWTIAEIYKTLAHAGKRATMFHYRESRGIEFDALVADDDCLHAIEIKSGATPSSAFFKNFRYLPARLHDGILPDKIYNHVVYGGETRQQRSDGILTPWCDVDRIVTDQSR